MPKVITKLELTNARVVITSSRQKRCKQSCACCETAMHLTPLVNQRRAGARILLDRLTVAPVTKFPAFYRILSLMTAFIKARHPQPDENNSQPYILFCTIRITRITPCLYRGCEKKSNRSLPPPPIVPIFPLSHVAVLLIEIKRDNLSQKRALWLVHTCQRTKEWNKMAAQELEPSCVSSPPTTGCLVSIAYILLHLQIFRKMFRI